MQRVIGLDIGSYSVKAVEIVNTFKSYEIANFYENVIPQLDKVSPSAVIPASMEQLFSENEIVADRIIAAIPGQYISSRILEFHFSDPKKIETAIYSEIEDLVPFNLDHMIIDHQILGEVDGKTTALVVMTKKVFLHSFLEHLRRLKIDPKLIDIDSLSFYNLSNYVHAEGEGTTAIIDIGHEKISLCLVADGILRMFRSINLGGKYITEFLARDMEIDFNQAQLLKHRVSRILCSADDGKNLNPEDYAIAERITLSMHALVKELNRTIYAFNSSGAKPVTTIYLSGGTSRLANIDLYLQERLNVEVKTNNLDQTELKLNPQLRDHMVIIPQSVAIGLRAVAPVKKQSRINLRRGEFAFVQNYESVLRATGNVFKLVAIALLVLSVSYSINYFFYDKNIRKIRTQYQKELVSSFPELKKKFRRSTAGIDSLHREAEKKFNSSINTKRTSIDQFLRSNLSSPPLEVLKVISEQLPKDLELNITLYQFNSNNSGGGLLVLKGETNGYDSVSKTLLQLQKVKALHNVREKSSQAKPGTDGKIIEFTFQANYAG